MSDKHKSVYGFCPVCGAKGKTRERRPNGDDTCESGHKYPSSTALQSPPTPFWQDRRRRLAYEI